jgi:hypothetical protein
MTLKEKFEQYAKQEVWEKKNYNAEECVEIAEQFAIEFAKWYEFTLRQSDNLNERFTPKELLEIYKEEKEL